MPSITKRYISSIGKKHFVLFSVPETSFPNHDLYTAAQNTVERAHLATRHFGEQGLQFREEYAIDHTTEKHQRYLASMRCKFLGHQLGDARAYARKETNDAAGVHLYEFNSVDFDSHKKKI